jgi:hypothetical protein
MLDELIGKWYWGDLPAQMALDLAEVLGVPVGRAITGPAGGSNREARRHERSNKEMRHRLGVANDMAVGGRPDENLYEQPKRWPPPR